MTVSAMLSCLRLAATRSTTGAHRTLATINIKPGTNLVDLSAAHGLQKARPWHPDGGASNDAADNTVELEALLGGRKVVIVGVPAPFTGTSTNVHVPGYAALSNEFLAVCDEVRPMMPHPPHSAATTSTHDRRP